MNSKTDWRITNQANYLKNKQLKHAVYSKSLLNREHDHCEFCMERFSEYDGDLHEGYCTEDEYHWICKQCFDDFKEMFNWDVQ